MNGGANFVHIKKKILKCLWSHNFGDFKSTSFSFEFTIEFVLCEVVGQGFLEATLIHLRIKATSNGQSHLNDWRYHNKRGILVPLYW